MNGHRNYNDGPDPGRSNRQAQIRSPPNDEHPRSDMAALRGSGPKKPYVPYQDSVYYNGFNGDSASSYEHHDTKPERDPRDDDPTYREVYERVRRRKRPAPDDSKDEDWEDHRYEDPRTGRVMGRYRGGGKSRYGDDLPPPIIPGPDDEKQPKDRYGDEEKDRERRSRRGSRKDDSRSRSRSDSRSRGSSKSGSRANPRNKDPDPKVRPQDDPKRPAEKYTALKAVKAAAWAGAVETARCRTEPGPWTGQKGKRVVLAASVGVVIGALRNGRLQHSGKMPYAEAAMTGFYAIDFLKRVSRNTKHGENAVKEQEQWHKDPEYVQKRDERAKQFQSSR